MSFFTSCCAAAEDNNNVNVTPGHSSYPTTADQPMTYDTKKQKTAANQKLGKSETAKHHTAANGQIFVDSQNAQNASYRLAMNERTFGGERELPQAHEADYESRYWKHGENTTDKRRGKKSLLDGGELKTMFDATPESRGRDAAMNNFGSALSEGGVETPASKRTPGSNARTAEKESVQEFKPATMGKLASFTSLDEDFVPFQSGSDGDNQVVTQPKKLPHEYKTMAEQVEAEHEAAIAAQGRNY